MKREYEPHVAIAAKRFVARDNELDKYFIYNLALVAPSDRDSLSIFIFPTRRVLIFISHPTSFLYYLTRRLREAGKKCIVYIFSVLPSEMYERA